ncbi:MAG: zinc ribbon domain-containing protein [Pseudomonadota bacterium]|nr:zinc ribbon domain-containing protein [Pseudomonadota bacterium]
MATEARYEMLWDCPRCETPKLLGLTHRHCPNCGGAQDPTKRYFPKEEDKVAVGDHPYVGADKACPNCETPNAAAAEFCVNCGSPIDDAKAVALRSEQVAAGRQFTEDSARNAREDLEAQRRPPPPPPPKKGGGGKALIVGALVLAIGLIVCTGLGALLFWKRESGVTVAGHTWAREIAIERYQAVSDTAWKDQLPSGARGVSCTQAERSTQKVADGQDCAMVRVDKGDGSFSEQEKCTTKYREEPVYDDKCSYVSDRWKAARTERAGGAAMTDTPRWPAVALACTGTTLGCEREGSRKETYTVSFTADDGKALGCDVEQAKWSTLPVGSTWKAPIGVLSGAIDCGALSPI